MGHVWKCCNDGFFPEVLGRGKAEKPRIVSLLEEIPPLWQVRVGIFRSQGAFLEPLNQWSSTFLAAGTGFAEDNFTMDWDGFRTIQARYIIVHFIFFYYCISSASDHQPLSPRCWALLLYII